MLNIGGIVLLAGCAFRYGAASVQVPEAIQANFSQTQFALSVFIFFGEWCSPSCYPIATAEPINPYGRCSHRLATHSPSAGYLPSCFSPSPMGFSPDTSNTCLRPYRS